MIKTLDEFLGMIDRMVRILCIALGAVMTVVVLIQVFARYIPFIKPPSWTEELARYVMIWMAMCAASHGIRVWDNVGVDFFFKKLSKQMQFVLDIVIKAVVLAVLAVVAYYCITVYPKVGMNQISATLRIPMFYAQLGVIIGLSLCCLQLLGRILIDLSKKGKEE